MDMDESWKIVFNRKAIRDIPDFDKACWTKEGYEELYEATIALVDKIGKEKGIKTIIDVGCGPGNYCQELYEKGYEPTGVDYSENMIDIAKRRYPDVKFSVGNGYNLQFPDNSFDLAMSIGALQCLYDHERFIKELARVARKIVIISTHIRDREEHDPKRVLHNILENDSWPVREYNKNEIIPLFEEAGYEVEIISEYNGKKIDSGTFIVARRK